MLTGNPNHSSYSSPEHSWGMPKRKSIPYLDVLSSVKLTKLQLDELHTECFKSEYGISEICIFREYTMSALETVAV